jgi:hypothetical protein
MRCAVITLVAGRHSHLQLQRTGLLAGSLRPDRHIVVTMQDGAVRNLLDERAPGWTSSKLRARAARCR